MSPQGLERRAVFYAALGHSLSLGGQGSPRTVLDGQGVGRCEGSGCPPAHGCLAQATLPDLRLGKAMNIQRSHKHKCSNCFGSKFRIGVSNFSS